MNKAQYIAQVILLLDCLPVLKEQDTFALKGGTAINFFIQNLPRLSVDIDLTYIKRNPREIAHKEIEIGLRELGEQIKNRNKNYRIKELKTTDGRLHKIVIQHNETKIKIEPNFIMRGTLHPVIKMNIVKAIEDRFEYSIKDIPILAKSELYAGKICAALSRQHPRDFFDVQQLLEKESITDEIREAFVIYLLCSPRPIHELLQPNLIDITQIYTSEFVDMAEQEVSLESLLNTREILIKTIFSQLTDREKEFILSVKKAQPDYTLMSFQGLDDLPALKWKLTNIQKMPKAKHLEMLNKLTAILA